MHTNDEKNTLKYSNSNQENPIFKMLGLENLEKDLDIYFSDNLKFINIKRKNSNFIFQFPVKPNDLTLFENHPDFNKLSSRYDKYISTYLPIIEDFIKKETYFLFQELPDVDFYSRIRIKSPFSYNKKMNDRILSGKDLSIHDIIGEKIVITKANGSTNPKDLESACFKVANSLDKFRKYTNFKVKSNSSNNKKDLPGNSNIPYITKDYISNPKPNGYKSLHIINQNSFNDDCSFETQIRTIDMEDNSKTNTNLSHSNYKSRYIDSSSLKRVPKYIEVTKVPDIDGYPTLYEIPDEYAFHHFYGFNYKNFIDELNSLDNIVNLNTLNKSFQKYYFENSLKSTPDFPDIK